MDSKYYQKKKKRNYIRACVLTTSISGSEYNKIKFQKNTSGNKQIHQITSTFG